MLNAGAVRFVYNYCLEVRAKTYQLTGKSMTNVQCNALIPKLKLQAETAWLAEANSQSLQAAVKDLDAAYSCFFRKLARFPRFKSKHKTLPSFRCYQNTTVDFERNTIQLSKHGKIKIALDKRRWDGRIVSAAIKRNARKQWFASVLVDDDKPEPVTPTKLTDLTGVDLGLTDIIVTSGPNRIKAPAPRYHKRELSRLRRAQRKVSRRYRGERKSDVMTKASHRYRKAKHRVAVIHGRVADRRNDFLHKLSTKLVAENQGLAFEDLNVKGMQKNRRLARAISDAGWAELVRQCEYKCKWASKPFVRIGRYAPSSKLCTCGVLNHKLQLKDRVWTCTNCGATHNRDELAADNIRRFALHPQVFLRAGSPEAAS